MIAGAAWATPAILVATSSPPAAASGGSSGTTPPVTGAALTEHHFGGGSGWDGPPSALTLQLQYAVKYMEGWPSTLVVPTTWVITLRDATGAVVGSATGTAAVSQSATAQVRTTLSVTKTGTHSASYLVTAGSATVDGVTYKPDDLMSQQPVTIVVDRLAW